MVAVVIFSLILAYGATVFRGDPVVICIGMNLLASGLTAYLLRQMFGVSGTFSDPAIVGLDKIRIAAVQAIPVLGWGFGRQTILTWLAWLLVVAIARRPLPHGRRPSPSRRRRAAGCGRDARRQRAQLSRRHRARRGRALRACRSAAFARQCRHLRRGHERRARLDRGRRGDARARQSALRRRRLRALRLRRCVQHPPAERGPAEPAHRHGALSRHACRAGHQPSPPQRGPAGRRPRSQRRRRAA